jgi:hypothetical protein
MSPSLNGQNPEIRTSSIDWAQLNRFHLKTETESSLRNVVFWKINRMVFLGKDRTMGNVQKHNICTHRPASSNSICILQFVDLMMRDRLCIYRSSENVLQIYNT